MRNNFILLLFLVILCSCKRGYQKDQENNEVVDNLKGIRIKGLDSLFKSNDPSNKVLFIFNGSCSNCIMSYLDFVENLKISSNVECLFITNSQDDYEIRYYMDKFNIKLNPNQILLVDNKGRLLEENEQLDEYLNILLLDKDNYVLTSLNPVSSNRGKEEYINLGILQDSDN